MYLGTSYSRAEFPWVLLMEASTGLAAWSGKNPSGFPPNNGGTYIARTSPRLQLVLGYIISFARKASFIVSSCSIYSWPVISTYASELQLRQPWATPPRTLNVVNHLGTYVLYRGRSTT